MDIVHTLEKGNAAEAISKSEVVIEGEVRVGGQEHFYLEPNISLAIPCKHDVIVTRNDVMKKEKRAPFHFSSLFFCFSLFFPSFSGG